MASFALCFILIAPLPARARAILFKHRMLHSRGSSPPPPPSFHSWTSCLLLISQSWALMLSRPPPWCQFCLIRALAHRNLALGVRLRRKRPQARDSGTFLSSSIVSPPEHTSTHGLCRGTTRSADALGRAPQWLMLAS